MHEDTRLGTSAYSLSMSAEGLACVSFLPLAAERVVVAGHHDGSKRPSLLSRLVCNVCVVGLRMAMSAAVACLYFTCYMSHGITVST